LFVEALRADALHDEAMAGDTKPVFSGYRVANFRQFIAAKFDQVVAALAVEMIVLGVAIVMLIDAPTLQAHLAEQAGLGQLIECAIDGCPTNILSIGYSAKFFKKIFGIKMFMMTEDLFDDHASLLGHPFSAALEKLLEPLHRCHRDFDRT